MSGFEVWFYFMAIPGIGSIFKLCSILLSLVFLFIFLECLISNDESMEYTYDDSPPIDFDCLKKNMFMRSKIVLRFLSVPLLICYLLAFLIPNKQEMAAIITIPIITKNEKVQNIGINTLGIIEEQFKEWVKETLPK